MVVNNVRVQVKEVQTVVKNDTHNGQPRTQKASPCHLDKQPLSLLMSDGSSIGLRCTKMKQATGVKFWYIRSEFRLVCWRSRKWTRICFVSEDRDNGDPGALSEESWIVPRV